MKAIELFAGAGGAALGLESAGIGHAALCEWDPDACATLRAAGLGPVVEGDVRDLDAIEAVAGSSCDLLWSSFPCQAFSAAGKRLGASDDRNGWPWTVDALDRFRPRWFLGENVRGLLCHSSAGCGNPMTCPRCYLDAVILPDLRERFAFAGYWLLDAADYGVPQHRRRIILWAGPRPVRPPAPTHADPATLAQGGLFAPRLLPWVSMGRTLMIESRPGCALDAQYLNEPAPTVRCGDSADFTFQDWCLMRTGRRSLNLMQSARLQDFPADHPWQGTKTARYRQVGNAVPPTLARVVAEAVLAADGGR